MACHLQGKETHPIVVRLCLSRLQASCLDIVRAVESEEACLAIIRSDDCGLFRSNRRMVYALSERLPISSSLRATVPRIFPG